MRPHGPHGLQPTRFLCPWQSPGKNTGVGCHFLLSDCLWYDQTTKTFKHLFMGICWPHLVVIVLLFQYLIWMTENSLILVQNQYIWQNKLFLVRKPLESLLKIRDVIPSLGCRCSGSFFRGHLSPQVSWTNMIKYFPGFCHRPFSFYVCVLECIFYGHLALLATQFLKFIRNFHDSKEQDAKIKYPVCMYANSGIIVVSESQISYPISFSLLS